MSVKIDINTVPRILMRNPNLTMSFTCNSPVPYATALGGVELGNMNDREHANVPGISSSKVGSLDASAMAARMGINIVDAGIRQLKDNSI